MYSFDGLERLIVFAVGLDVAIAQSSSSADLETRSQLYRALTRSHMLAVVINEVLQGGWLEFLGTVKLKEGASFDRVAERKRMNKDAVEALVAERLKLIDAALKEVSASTAVLQRSFNCCSEGRSIAADIVAPACCDASPGFVCAGQRGAHLLHDQQQGAPAAEGARGETSWQRRGGGASGRRGGEVVGGGEDGAACGHRG